MMCTKCNLEAWLDERCEPRPGRSLKCLCSIHLLQECLHRAIATDFVGTTMHDDAHRIAFGIGRAHVWAAPQMLNAYRLFGGTEEKPTAIEEPIDRRNNRAVRIRDGSEVQEKDALQSGDYVRRRHLLVVAKHRPEVTPSPGKAPIKSALQYLQVLS